MNYELFHYLYRRNYRSEVKIKASFHFVLPSLNRTFASVIPSLMKKDTLGEIIRFGIVGGISTALHYGIYWVLQHVMNVNIAYTIGYVLSFLVNYYLTAHFTFNEKTTKRNGAGFGGAHLINYCLQIVLLNFFLWLGLSRAVAPFGVYAIAVPTNFLLVRFVFKHFKRK